MREEVRPNIYRCEIPLPRNPLKMLNSYIIKDGKDSVIIDTGFNQKECKDAFYEHLRALDIDISRSRVLFTHVHADHCGMASEMYKRGAELYFSEIDGEIVMRETQESGWDEAYRQMKLFGFEESNDFFESHPAKAYGTEDGYEYSILKEGDVVSIGDYNLEVISVPGHTPDIITFYEREHKLYFSADHVLDVITPNIGWWGDDYEVILQQYFDSLRKIRDYDVELVLPSHRKLIPDLKQRVDELLEHHRVRLEEIIRIMGEHGEEMTVQDIAARMQWRINARNWDEFPDAQKWFASSEAMAHMDYLLANDKVVNEVKDGVFYFTLKN